MSEKFIPCGTDENLEGGHWVGQKAPEPPTFKVDWIPSNNQHFTLTTSPHNDVIGYWALGKSPFATRFPVYYKPTPEQIENHRTMLGWEWRDAE